MLHVLQVSAVGPSSNNGSNSSNDNGSSGTTRVLVDGSADGNPGSSAGLQHMFKGGLFKGAATLSLSSTDDERVAADEAAGQVLIPKHWEEQIRTAPLGRRRVMRRCALQLRPRGGWHWSGYAWQDCWQQCCGALWTDAGGRAHSQAAGINRMQLISVEGWLCWQQRCS